MKTEKIPVFKIFTQVKKDTVAAGGGSEASSELKLEAVKQNEKYRCKAEFQDPSDEILSDLTLVYVNRKLLYYILHMRYEQNIGPLLNTFVSRK